MTTTLIQLLGQAECRLNAVRLSAEAFMLAADRYHESKTDFDLQRAKVRASHLQRDVTAFFVTTRLSTAPAVENQNTKQQTQTENATS